MTLSIIVAMAKNRVIGNKGKIPWRIVEDLKRFKQITMGHPIIMGRKTFESIGKPLAGRNNIVITRNKNYRPQGIKVARDLQEALELRSSFVKLRMSGHGESVEPCPSEQEAFVIGGAEIYRLALPQAERIYLTLIDQDFEGDTFFPEVDLKKDFRILEKGPNLVSSKNQIPFRFITYQYRHTR